MKTKEYRVWKKVETWVCETYWCEDGVKDKDIIDLLGEDELYDGCYGDKITCGDCEWSNDYHIIEYDDNRGNPTIELYDEGGDLIWNNTPVDVLRENKLEKLFNI
jgi:hypothetical protein